MQLKKFMRLMTTRLWGRETRVRLSHVLMALLRSSSTVSGNVSEVMVSPREHADTDHIHRETVQFAGHNHVAARAVIAAEYAVVRVIIPVGSFARRRDAGHQHQQEKNQA